MTRRIDISYKTIIFIAVFLLSLWVLFLIRDIILLFFVAFIFMSALSPLVNRLVKLKIPKTLAVLIIFLLLLSIIITIVTLGLTPLINQTSNLSQKLIESLGYLLQTNMIKQSVIQQEISSLSHQAITFTIDLVENIIRFVSVIVITLYLLLDRERIESWLASFFVGHRERAERMVRIIEEKLGAWLRGQIILSLLVAVLVYFGLVILGLDFALPLAIIAGLLEVVPVIGPIIAAVPGILIGLTISPFMALVIAGLYLAVQQIENHVIVPQVMKKAVGLNPILVILAISIGGRLLGIGGALLAVPIAVVIQVILQEVLRSNTS